MTGVDPQLIAKYFKLGEKIPIEEVLKRLADINKTAKIYAIAHGGYDNIRDAYEKGVPDLKTAILNPLPPGCYIVRIYFSPFEKLCDDFTKAHVFALYPTEDRKHLRVENTPAHQAFLDARQEYVNPYSLQETS